MVSTLQGTITDIQRFSVHDGPGIRTTVFFKGCNLRCAWCHNPETLRPQPELQFLPEHCIGCGACMSACPHGAHVVREGQHVLLRDQCRACGACARGCYAEALSLVGQVMSVDDVVAQVLEDRAFYADSQGGVTISGGEPLFQREFAMAILARCRAEGIHTAIESNMAWPWQHVEPVLPLVDLVMMDIKCTDARDHRAWTGLANDRVLSNAVRVSREVQQLIVRTPVIPGYNDTESEINSIAQFCAQLPNLAYYELLGYHPLGTQKYAALGMTYEIPDARPLPRERLYTLARIAAQQGIALRVNGERIEK